jgi:hypothetical protein
MLCAALFFGILWTPAPGRCEQAAFKPFMLFVTTLAAPPGMSASAFTDDVYRQLASHFDTTAFQPIRVAKVSRAVSMSNRKRDIIISADKHDCYYRGTAADTIVAWAKFRVGLIHCRIAQIFTPEQRDALPAMLAEQISQHLREQLMGVIELEGGPKHMRIAILDGQSVSPPRRLLLPAGTYAIRCSYPGFAERVDTLRIDPGKTLAKRILLLPH